MFGVGKNALSFIGDRFFEVDDMKKSVRRVLIDGILFICILSKYSLPSKARFFLISVFFLFFFLIEVMVCFISMRCERV